MLFTEKGPSGTGATLEAAAARAKELKINHIAVASNTGETVKRLLPLAAGIHMACITHHTGFRKPGEQEMSRQVREELSSSGVSILTTTHLLGGIDRRRKTSSAYISGRLIAHTLRMLGQGTKVAVEIAVIFDAGTPYGEDIIAIGGSGRGDTALVIRPEHAKNFFDSKIKEIICKPREF